MSFIALLAMRLGRLNRLINAICFAGALMVLINPRLLRDDVGFQLSFLAVFGIIYFYPIFSQPLEKVKNKFLNVLLEILFLTLAAQVFTLPIIAYNFKQVSLIAPLSNLLVLWAISPVMLLIFVALILGLLFPSLAFIWFMPANLLLKYMIFIVDYLSQVPLAFISLDYLWSGWLIIYYFIVVMIVWKTKKRGENL
jgi:competence protein ComEC